MERIGAIEKIQRDNLFPPQHMKRDAVLAHALDHLALLSRDDRGIQEVLAPEWMGILQTRLPKPAAFVQNERSLPKTYSTFFVRPLSTAHAAI
jgi:hypothetical protein